MAQVNQIEHRVIRHANLPYVSNVTPTNTEPAFVSGSSDILTSIAGYCERRPGFADNLETTPTTFNNLQRVFCWDRNDGSFIQMACDINSSGQAVVYKRIMNIDSSFSSIYTDTGSNTAFDFVVSNDTVYFSNGNVAKKWDPTNGVSNWGIAISSVNNVTGPTVAGAGADGGGSHAWSNPSNVTSAVNYASVTLAQWQTSNNLQATTYGFAIPSTNTILGINVTFDWVCNQSYPKLVVKLLKAGVAISGSQTVQLSNGSGSAVVVPTSNTSYLWGTTWTPNDINQSNFGVQFFANNISGAAGATVQVRNVKLTIYSLGGPTVAVAGGAGTFTATTGYQYVFCYGNSNTGHVSSPTPASASTGAFSNKLNVAVTLTASTDSQVNQIRVFRSTDSVASGGAAAAYFELPTSPYPNTSGNITDNASDASLLVTNIAPTSTFNDPPTPGQRPVYFSGRIWLFSGNKVYFSGLEETILGVPEESFPSGVSGNFWAFDQPVTGLAVAGSSDNQTLLIFCGGRLYGIVGNTLDTFRRFVISNRRGCRSLAAISALGGLVAWLDSSNQIWSTDGTGLQELSLPIRPDLASVTPANCSMTFHVSGKYHWLVFSTGTQLFVYDLDTEQWCPPWTFTCNNINSGETAAGTYKLIASKTTKAITLSTTSHNDNGSTYQPIAVTSFMSLVPDTPGAYDEPSRAGYPDGFCIDTNNVSLSDVLYLADDDPASGTYTSIAAQNTTPQTDFNRNQGTYLVQRPYRLTKPSGRWISWKIKGQTADDSLKIYDWFMTFKKVGGR